MAEDPSDKEVQRLHRILGEAYCTGCLKWYNIKKDSKKHQGH